jgi:hypothetical protein
MHINVNLNLLEILIIVTGVLAIIDSVIRVRGRRGVLGIVELIAGVLLILSNFVSLPHILGQTIMQIVLEVVLILLLVFRGGTRRGGIAITIITLILNTVLILLTLNWITLPGLHLS